MKQALSFINSIKNKKTLILGHSGADVDSFASCSALHLALKAKTTIGIPDHLNTESKILAENLGIKYKLNPLLEEYEAIILVDLNSLSMLGSYSEKIKSFKCPKLVIDHHPKARDPIKATTLINSKKISSTEIIYELLKELKADITPKIASCIAAGIVTDSAHFLVADHNTFKIMAEMLEKSGKTFSQLTHLFSYETDISERIAKIKSVKRAEVYRIGNYVLSLSHVSVWEGSAAKALITLGSDLAFVSSANGELRVSGRASSRIIRETGIHLGKDIFERIALKGLGAGGGHAGAAGLNKAEEKSLPEINKLILALVQEFLKARKGKAALTRVKEKKRGLLAT